jgi:hypothetical protein
MHSFLKFNPGRVNVLHLFLVAVLLSAIGPGESNLPLSLIVSFPYLLYLTFFRSSSTLPLSLLNIFILWAFFFFPYLLACFFQSTPLPSIGNSLLFYSFTLITLVFFSQFSLESLLKSFNSIAFYFLVYLFFVEIPMRLFFANLFINIRHSIGLRTPLSLGFLGFYEEPSHVYPLLLLTVFVSLLSFFYSSFISPDISLAPRFHYTLSFAALFLQFSGSALLFYAVLFLTLGLYVFSSFFYSRLPLPFSFSTLRVPILFIPALAILFCLFLFLFQYVLSRFFFISSFTDHSFSVRVLSLFMGFADLFSCPFGQGIGSYYYSRYSSFETLFSFVSSIHLLDSFADYLKNLSIAADISSYSSQAFPFPVYSVFSLLACEFGLISFLFMFPSLMLVYRYARLTSAFFRYQSALIPSGSGVQFWRFSWLFSFALIISVMFSFFWGTPRFLPCWPMAFVLSSKFADQFYP